MNSNQNNRSFPVILIDIKNTELVLGVLDKAREFGWRIVNLAYTTGVITYEHNLSGVIISQSFDHPEILPLYNLNCPVVRIGPSPHFIDQEIPKVISDDRQIGEIAADHFIERNFHHLCYIGHKPLSNTRQIYETFNHRVEEKGCECNLLQLDRKLLEKDTKTRSKIIREIFIKWISEIPKPVGLLTYNDFFAAKLIAYCLAENIAVPEEVAVLGCGNVKHVCETALIPMSSIDRGTFKMGQQAANMLSKLINGEKPPKQPLIITPARIVLRQSTDLLATSNPLVAKATRFIWDHLNEQISIGEIAHNLGVSRSILDHAFKRHLGRSPNKERLRKRLERCSELLLSTNRTISDIARSVGFPSVNYLHIKFKSEFGLTPRQYRINKNKKLD